ncbi:nickel pincer cofactor biosynthesis protein LarC [Ligilactobacillus equi]|uniref:Pyridinium-3,5-bisthiocarboxylic acid mononucleotide nickel insertion protein n=1 Tax=Ligilactobacillus equi DSM 15833 = JCM 10991 TaxID=1423740 RepID=A0A0R1TUH3_9LACO|nr:nickel pincer cofactor biosynthesis protein LarC [Ligilactobacillus equi]KRL82602.1 hypothetical protein FC36_GL000897 [Ligilactobacillus equi DSM 15833 = JCM 10991]MCQ2557434.1 nickel pincer cofactor biosynthesis protein LarC [Ligilactobacillus sp.]
MADILFLEPFSGLSGDMLNGLLLDLGADFQEVQTELTKLHLPEFTVSFQRNSHSSIYGGNFEVHLTNHVHKDQGLSHHYEHEHHHNHKHEHHHEIRNLAAINDILDQSDLSADVKEHSKNVFFDIAQAEARVHHVSLDEIHFHEVGATDSIVDVVAFFIAFEKLGIKRVYTTAVTDGTGFIQVAHGNMPVPVPAVMQLRQNTNLIYRQDSEIHTELVTPTGLAILKELKPITSIPEHLQVEKIGYGFGKRQTGKLNALRGSLATLKHSHEEINTTQDQIAKLEVNLDDQSPEELGYIFDLLLEAGALDVFWTNIIMKKNRPAVLLTVLCQTQEQAKFRQLLWEHTTTLGVRSQVMTRTKATRHFEKITTPFGEITVKVGMLGSQVKRSLEYDDCARIARKYQLPIHNVYQKLQPYLQGELK